MADVLIEQGERKAAIQTRQRILVRLLRKRFRDVLDSAVRTVQATADVEQLDDWLDRFATADTLDELNFQPKR
jgi:hypothetical protein